MKEIKGITFLLLILFLGCTKKEKDEKELTIHMHFRNKFTYDENWPVAKEAKRFTGINLKGMNKSGETKSRDLFEVMMSSNKYPDIVAGDNLANSFIKYGEQGIFTPLNSLIEESAPNIKKFLEENPEIKKAISNEKGDIYYIPYITSGETAAGYWIRKDWLDKLSLKIPETVEEYYKVLKAFKTQDPNGNGKQDEIPLFFRKWQDLLSLVTLWNGRSSGTRGSLSFYYDGKKFRAGWMEPEFKEGIKNIAKWYKEGLIDPEVFTRGEKAREILFSENRGGGTRDWFASTGALNSIIQEKNNDFLIIPIAPPKNIVGKRVEETRRIKIRPDGWGIISYSKNKLLAIKYFDFFFSEEGRRLANFGVENIHYEMRDGIPKFKETILNGDKPVNTFMWDIGAQIPIGFEQDYEYEKQWTSDIALKGIEEYQQNRYFVDLDPKIEKNLEYVEAYDEIWPTLNYYISEMMIRWVLGEGDVEEEWEIYLKNIDNLRGNELINILNSEN